MGAVGGDLGVGEADGLLPFCFASSLLLPADVRFPLVPADSDLDPATPPLSLTTAFAFAFQIKSSIVFATQPFIPIQYITSHITNRTC